MLSKSNRNLGLLCLVLCTSSLIILVLTFSSAIVGRSVLPYRGDINKANDGRHLQSSWGLPLFNYVKSLRCDYPYVYNKPPKTASSLIRETIEAWAAETGRTNYHCSNQPMAATAVLRECLPSAGDQCGVLNCHVILDGNARQLLERRLPNYRTITSTRDGNSRVLSSFLQSRRLVVDDMNSTVLQSKLREHLKKTEIWALYNYHTGEARVGSCPLTYSEHGLIFGMVSRYDIVIDANLKNVSNAILKHHGLFALPEKGGRVNERGAHRMELPQDLKQAVKRVSCVDDALHRAFKFRMASLYEQATGEKCVQAKNTCLDDMEKETAARWT